MSEEQARMPEAAQAEADVRMNPKPDHLKAQTQTISVPPKDVFAENNSDLGSLRKFTKHTTVGSKKRAEKSSFEFLSTIVPSNYLGDATCFPGKLQSPKEQDA